MILQAIHLNLVMGNQPLHLYTVLHHDLQRSKFTAIFLWQSSCLAIFLWRTPLGDSEPPGILCESCACIIHTNLQSCMSIISEHSTINLSLTSEESLTDSKLPDTGYLKTKGQESVYETCACVIHTILLSYMCINNYCQSFHINVCAGYMCFVKL